MFCPNCGADLPDGSKVCSSCGLDFAGLGMNVSDSAVNSEAEVKTEVKGENETKNVEPANAPKAKKGNKGPLKIVIGILAFALAGAAGAGAVTLFSGSNVSDTAVSTSTASNTSSQSSDSDAAQSSGTDESQASSSNCSGYEGGTVFRNHTYKAFDEGVNWDEAEAQCERMGGHLVTISSKEEENIVERVLGSHSCYWIGLSDNETEGSFVWVTGEPLTYTKWADGQPDNYDDREDWVMITARDIQYDGWGYEGKLWNDVRKAGDGASDIRDFGYVCEWDETFR